MYTCGTIKATDTLTTSHSFLQPHHHHRHHHCHYRYNHHYCYFEVRTLHIRSFLSANVKCAMQCHQLQVLCWIVDLQNSFISHQHFQASHEHGPIEISEMGMLSRVTLLFPTLKNTTVHQTLIKYIGARHGGQV